MNSRELILGRVRRALADVSPDESSPYRRAIDRAYLDEHTTGDGERLIELLAANLAEYRAFVHRTDTLGLPATITRLLAVQRTRRLAVPAGLPETWLASTEATRVRDSDTLTHADLDAVDSVVTECALAIAETGTIVLDGGLGQGHRRLTLIPDHHVCVIRVPDQVVSSVPAAIARLDPARPLTWISGPSATSDIELRRIEVVHGPRRLDAIQLTGSASES